MHPQLSNCSSRDCVIFTQFSAASTSLTRISGEIAGWPFAAILIAMVIGPLEWPFAPKP